MRGLVYEAPWQLELRELPEDPPGSGEVTVAVRASGICGSDVHGFAGTTGRRTPPLVMGHEVAGEVAEVAPDVESLAPGDRVVLRSLLACGACRNCWAGRRTLCSGRRLLGGDIPGGYAQRVTVPAAMAVPLPDGISWPTASMVEPLSVAMHALNRTPFDLLDTVVVVGAGTIGLLALVTARLRGAGTLVVSDRNRHRLDVASALGADVTVDVSQSSLPDVVRDLTDGVGADAVLEAVGLPATSLDSLAACRAGGHVTWIGNSDPKVELGMQDLVTRELTLSGAYGADAEFERAIAALHVGRVDTTSLVELVAPLEDGPRIMTQLAKGEIDAVKVVLVPEQ